MIKIQFSKKKLLFTLFFIFATFFVCCLEKNNKVLNENNYRKKSNWTEVTNNFKEVSISYSIQNYEGIPVVTELYYYAIKKNGECITLGSFTKNDGFMNSNKEEFILDTNLKKDSEFFKDRIIGLSVDSIDKPFSLKGMAISSDNKIYETEILCRLYINCENQSLEEWFPEI